MVTKKKPRPGIKIGPIEKDVPLPPRRNPRMKYPFKELRPGESFVVQGAPMHKISAAVGSHRKRYPSSVFRLSIDQKTGGVRVHKEAD